MPFSLEETLHVFEMTVEGGLQDVVAREGGGPEPIDLIREHLREQAERFARGDFVDPASIHGEDMPGLAELAAGAEGLEVVYSRRCHLPLRPGGRQGSGCGATAASGPWSGAHRRPGAAAVYPSPSPAVRASASASVIMGFWNEIPSAPVMTPKSSVLSTIPRLPLPTPAP